MPAISCKKDIVEQYTFGYLFCRLLSCDVWSLFRKKSYHAVPMMFIGLLF